MDDRATISVSGPNDGYVLDVLGADIRVQSSGRPNEMFFADHPVPAGYEVPLHVHRDEDELFYILDGEITLLSQAGERLAGPGSFVHLPRGIPHGFVNRTESIAHMLVITTPGGALHRSFKQIDKAARDGTLDSDVVAGALARNRIELV